jgi:hypothetical protein
MVGANAVRVAFVSSEIRVLASAMNRAYPRLKSDFRIGGDPNGDYVPGKAGIPFLVALVATDGTVKIGVELTNGVRHPIVELVAKPRSNVRRTGATYSWMPAWTQFRILCAEFSIDPPAVERTRAEFSSMISAKPTP